MAVIQYRFRAAIPVPSSMCYEWVESSNLTQISWEYSAIDTQHNSNMLSLHSPHELLASLSPRSLLRLARCAIWSVGPSSGSFSSCSLSWSLHFGLCTLWLRTHRSINHLLHFQLHLELLYCHLQVMHVPFKTVLCNSVDMSWFRGYSSSIHFSSPSSMPLVSSAGG